MNCNLCLNNIRIAYVNKAFYHYDCFTNRTSLTQTPDRMNMHSRIAFVSYIEQRLDAEAYREELNSLKCLTKKVAWTSQLYNKKEFLDLYKEINPVYTRYQEKHSPTAISLRLCLSGHYVLATIAFRLWRFVKTHIK